MENLCRICLTQRRNLRSVFQTEKNSVSFYEMITYISNIKITQNDGYPDKICLICRNKLKDAYDFKCLIESSDKQLRNDDSCSKKLYFNNFCDIKIEIDCFKTEPEVKCENLSNELLFNFNTSEHTEINYKDICIKRLNFKDENINNNKQVLSVEEFLNTIKDEIGDEYYENDFNDDDELYTPPSIYNKKSKGKRKYNNCNRKAKGKIKIQKPPYVNSYGDKITPVKPIVLKDVRVVRTPGVFKKRNTNKIRKHRTKETICPYCGKITKSMKNHLLIHTGEKKYKCTKCDKCYFTEQLLKKHYIVHSGVKNFSCDQCVAMFYTIDGLRRHKESHTNVNSHICDICSKGFKRKSGLTKHLQRHSSANKTVNCELCNMSFFEKFQLKHHMRVHTGERPYNCELCTQPYSYKHDFNRHCLKKHGVFLKRRSVYTLTAAVLSRERGLMKELAQGVENPFHGPQGALAYQYAIRALQNDQLRLLDP